MQQCKKCSKETNNYAWCNECIDEFVNSADAPREQVMERLWELEEDAFVMATLFHNKTLCNHNETL